MNSKKYIIFSLVYLLFNFAQLYAIEPGDYLISIMEHNNEYQYPYRGMVLSVSKDKKFHLKIAKTKESDIIVVENISIINGDDKNSFIMIVRWKISKEYSSPGKLVTSTNLLSLSFKDGQGSGSNLTLDEEQAEYLEASIGKIERDPQKVNPKHREIKTR